MKKQHSYYVTYSCEHDEGVLTGRQTIKTSAPLDSIESVKAVEAHLLSGIDAKGAKNLFLTWWTPIQWESAADARKGSYAMACALLCFAIGTILLMLPR